MEKSSKQFLVFGLGPIGIGILRSLYKMNKDSIVGAVDIDPEKVGKDVGDLINTEKINVPVVSSIGEIETLGDETIAIHAAGSNLEKVWPQIKELLDSGYNVVSTCEELSYPWHRYPELAKEINEYAQAKESRVVGTGINPGFVMDTLAIVFSTVLNQPDKIVANRRVDVSKRRSQLQKKVGAGLSKSEFENLAEDNQIGHVGLEESLRLTAYALNWELESVSNQIEPTISKVDTSIPLTDLKKGDVNGHHQISYGKTADGKEISMNLVMSVGVEQEDEIIINNQDEAQRLLVPNGVFGDTATAAITINTGKHVSKIQKSGLLTMADIGLPSSLAE